MLRKVSRSLFTKRTLVSDFPSLKWNRGPAVSPQTDKYAIIAVIGHTWVRPRYMSTPFLKGSVLEDFIQTYMMVGFVGLSTAMSEKLRCAPESYSLSEGMQISPARRKPKKHVVYAAHAIMLSNSSGCLLRN